MEINTTALKTLGNDRPIDDLREITIRHSGIDVTAIARNEDLFPVQYDVPSNDPLLRKAIYKAFKGRCFYTSLPIDTSEMEVDHIIPRSLGGADNIFNYVLTSLRPNRVKSDKFDNSATAGLLFHVRLNYAPKVVELYQDNCAKVGITRVQLDGPGSLFAEFPLALPGYKSSHKTFVIAEASPRHQSESRAKCISLIPDTTLGLPTALDYRILVALANGFGVSDCGENSSSFSLNSIAKALGARSPSGKEIRRVQLGLERWASTHIVAENIGFISSNEHSALCFRIFDSIDLDRRRAVWSSVSLENLSGLKVSGPDRCLSHVSTWTSRLHLFLERRFQIFPVWTFAVDELISLRIGSCETKKIYKLKQAFSELEAAGIITRADDSDRFHRSNSGERLVRLIKCRGR